MEINVDDNVDVKKYSRQDFNKIGEGLCFRDDIPVYLYVNGERIMEINSGDKINIGR